MGLKSIMAAGIGVALAAGCTPEEAPPPVDPPPADQPAQPPAPAADDEFVAAAAYECAGHGEIRVIYEMGATASARIKLATGEVLTLPMQTNAIEPSYSDGTNSFGSIGSVTMTLNTATLKGVACTPVSRPVPAPKLAGMTLELKESDAGKDVELKVGDKFSVSLSGVPTAGYVWGVEKMPGFLAKAGETSGSTTSSQAEPGFAGGNHWEVLGFEAIKAGSGELELSQRRPWEDKAAPDDKRWKVKVTVK
jgi:predicted secreted protein